MKLFYRHGDVAGQKLALACIRWFGVCQNQQYGQDRQNKEVSDTFHFHGRVFRAFDYSK
jgi:hypothetical protein